MKKAFMIDIDGVICVKPDLYLLGDNKMICEANSGDTTLGVTGINTIEERFDRQYDGEMVRIKAQGLLPVETTPEHPLLVASSKTYLPRVSFGDLAWKKAEDVRAKLGQDNGDYLVLPRLKGTVDADSIDLRNFTTSHGADICKAQGVSLSFPLNRETSWMLGLYAAEGCPVRDSQRNKTIEKSQFSLCVNEAALIERLESVISNLGYKPLTRSVKSVTVVFLQSRVIAKAISQLCGMGATNKMIPDAILFHKDPQILSSFLEGYLDGDGCIVPRGFTALTVSRLLALQLQLLCGRLGIPLSVTKKETNEFGYIQNRKVALHHCYRMQAYPAAGPRQRMKVLQDHILCPVRKIEKVHYSGKVYNVRTSDNTYLACNAVVHNCLHVPNEFPEKMKTVPEIEGAKEWVNSKYDEGNYICFFTARLEEHRKITEKWLAKHGFKYHQIIFGKPRGGNYHYIDKAHVQATTFKGKFSPMVSVTHGIEVFED